MFQIGEKELKLSLSTAHKNFYVKNPEGHSRDGVQQDKYPRSIYKNTILFSFISNEQSESETEKMIYNIV